MTRIDVPCSIKCVANEWRRVRGEMRLLMPALRAATLTARWTVSGQMEREGSFLLGNNKPTG